MCFSLTPMLYIYIPFLPTYNYDRSHLLRFSMDIKITQNIHQSNQITLSR